MNAFVLDCPLFVRPRNDKEPIMLFFGFVKNEESWKL